MCQDRKYLDFLTGYEERYMKYKEQFFSIALVFVFLILASSVALGSQTEKPVADFSANITGGTVPLAVKFTDDSIGGVPIFWCWDFGDSNYSKHAMNTTHTFTMPGVYNITLRVKNEAGSSSITRSGYITVEAPTDTSGKVLDPSGTRWSVAGFEGGFPREYHEVPWEFHSQYCMNAGDLWTGNWSFVPDSPDRVHTFITHANGETDSCDVVFVSPNWFVAVKDDELYRLGKRI